MEIYKLKKSRLLLIILALIFTFGVMTAWAQEKVKVKFKAFAVVTKIEKLKVDDTEGHVISLYESTGVTSDGKFVRYFKSRNDLIKGNGTISGYGKYVNVKDGDYYWAKYQGTANTTKSPEGKLKFTLEGNYSYINGTGKYKGIQGGGTFKGGAIGKGIADIDVEGEYVIKK